MLNDKHIICLKVITELTKKKTIFYVRFPFSEFLKKLCAFDLRYKMISSWKPESNNEESNLQKPRRRRLAAENFLFEPMLWSHVIRHNLSIDTQKLRNKKRPPTKRSHFLLPCRVSIGQKVKNLKLLTACVPPKKYQLKQEVQANSVKVNGIMITRW